MKLLFIAALAIAPAFAQDAASDARLRLENVAALAGAYFHSADSIEWRLNQDGSTLHPETTALRARIVAALNQARRAIDDHDLKSADRAMAAAEALVERFSKKLGG